MSKVTEIVGAFQDALEFWGLHLGQDGHNLKEHVPPATVSNPLEELAKLAKLIKAHTTRVGIIFEPSKLRKQTDAAYNTVSELSKSFVMYISALALLSPEKISNLFFQEIAHVSKNLVDTALLFAAELRKLEELDEESEVGENESNPRLVSVGKMWSVCDELVKLIEVGNLKFLEQKTRMQLLLIEDGLDEFAEWAENPEEFDDEDPFGLDDDVSIDAKVPNDEDEPSEDKLALTEYCKQWLQKFKLVKLLFLSINKSLPTITAGPDIDEIYRSQVIISREIDRLIVELMMNQELSEQVDEHAKAVDKACFKILKIVRSASKNNEAKVKWCSSWETKYKELLESMYKDI